jgi:hypothetical protein
MQILIIEKSITESTITGSIIAGVCIFGILNDLCAANIHTWTTYTATSNFTSLPTAYL